ALLKTVSNFMPNNTCITTDVGQHQMWAAQHMDFDDPSNFLTSGGMGTMGFGLPAAIGAQISRPHDTVIAVSGDGSIMMNVQELATIKRYQIPVKVVLIDNAKLGMVRQWQDLFFDGRLSETDLSDNPDFVMLATAFDIKAKQISKKSEIDAAVKEMLDHDGPYFLQVKIDASENVWPLVPPNTANDKMMESV
ncbi:MAG TPA: acetolactate synthase large subunit, partial [Colwellia sp.]|nr:acetolactate synthase large subunit [Colwellia sp.]